MIVCSCNVLTDAEIRDVINSETCPRTPGAVYKCLGCSPNCGRCIATLRTIISEALGDTIPAASLCRASRELDASCGMDAEPLCSL
ncbi:MAG TPA: (2Fe-2S)-binding protein [Methylocella sp.]|nr:(2Fe-2S)-binding protein [Methylocella sp.]